MENGINCTMDGFYSAMHDSRFSKERGIEMQKTFDELKRLRVTGVDMESACILTLAQLMGIKACVVTLATVLENLKDFMKGAERAEAEDLLCRVTMEGLYEYSKQE